MKKPMIFLLSIMLFFPLSAQHLGTYELVVQEASFDGLPGLQSFAVGQYEGRWLVIGGRTDGLHRRQPWASFWEEDNNKDIFVIDPAEKKVWSASLSALPASMYEQLQSTNMEFEQRGDILYILGGYGYSASADQHITHPYLTAIDVPEVIEAIVEGESFADYFRQIRDERVQVTGGYLGLLGDYFYLVGGQRFMGLYNPMGPNHGPGFVQEYTNQVRKFQIVDDGETLAIENYSTQTDEDELHRRDYNLSPQIFPDRSPGFTAFSGVFQHDVDLPWLNTVDVFEDGYQAQHDFNQYLNQYHTAHLAAYDWDENVMYTVFFGGISRYYLDENGNLTDDRNVPFVTTISLVERDAEGVMSERKIGDMPELLGSGAEFIPRLELERYENGVINLNAQPGDDILLGYVFGGIQSSGANIFFINTGEQSTASNRLFSVRLVKGNAAAAVEADSAVHRFAVFPNPSRDGLFQIEFQLTRPASLTVDLLNAYGGLVQSEMVNQSLPAGEHQLKLRLNRQPPGMYYLRIYDGTAIQTRKVLRQ